MAIEPTTDIPHPGLDLSEPQSPELYRLAPPANFYNSAFHSALAKARSEFGLIARTREVLVRSDKGNYTFRYAPLENIFAAVMPALNANGFYLYQQPHFVEGGWVIDTILLHAAGSISNRYPVSTPAREGAQPLGGAMTYARRYGATMLLGVAAEDDLDANDGEGNDVEIRSKRHGARAVAIAATIKQPGSETRMLTPEEESRKEGLIVDACDELLEAASEGRKIGIEQIWNEIKGDEYVAVRVWDRLKKRSPDLFRTIEEVLRPASKEKRGPKPK